MLSGIKMDKIKVGPTFIPDHRVDRSAIIIQKFMGKNDIFKKT